MSIYDSGFNKKPKTLAQKRDERGNSLRVNPKDLLNDKKLNDFLKTLGIKTNGAKELLYDIDGNVLGVLTRSDIPYIFSEKEVKTVEDALNGRK